MKGGTKLTTPALHVSVETICAQIYSAFLVAGFGTPVIVAVFNQAVQVRRRSSASGKRYAFRDLVIALPCAPPGAA